MRHNVDGRKLGRTKAHRRALYRNLVNALITHERIRTTTPKAKEARRLAERVRAEMGPPSVLVHCAGRARDGLFMRSDFDHHLERLGEHLVAAMALASGWSLAPALALWAAMAARSVPDTVLVKLVWASLLMRSTPISRATLKAM